MIDESTFGRRNWSCPRLSADGTKCWNKEHTVYMTPTCYESPCAVPSIEVQMTCLKKENEDLRELARQMSKV